MYMTKKLLLALLALSLGAALATGSAAAQENRTTTDVEYSLSEDTWISSTNVDGSDAVLTVHTTRENAELFVDDGMALWDKGTPRKEKTYALQPGENTITFPDAAVYKGTRGLIVSTSRTPEDTGVLIDTSLSPATPTGYLSLFFGFLVMGTSGLGITRALTRLYSQNRIKNYGGGRLRR